MFTKFLHDVEALESLLTRAYTRRCCTLFQNVRATSKGRQFRRMQKGPKINWLSYRSLGYLENCVNLIIPTHLSTKARGDQSSIY